MGNEYKFYIESRYGGADADLFLIQFHGDKLFSYTTDENGCLEYEEIKQGQKPNRPLISFRFPSARPLLIALAEGLKNFGIVAEVDNAQRITAQALAEERERQLKIEQEQNNHMINSLFQLLKNSDKQ